MLKRVPTCGMEVQRLMTQMHQQEQMHKAELHKHMQDWAAEKSELLQKHALEKQILCKDFMTEIARIEDEKAQMVRKHIEEIAQAHSHVECVRAEAVEEISLLESSKNRVIADQAARLEAFSCKVEELEYAAKNKEVSLQQTCARIDGANFYAAFAEAEQVWLVRPRGKNNGIVMKTNEIEMAREAVTQLDAGNHAFVKEKRKRNRGPNDEGRLSGKKKRVVEKLEAAIIELADESDEELM